MHSNSAPSPNSANQKTIEERIYGTAGFKSAVKEWRNDRW